MNMYSVLSAIRERPFLIVLPILILIVFTPLMFTGLTTHDDVYAFNTEYIRQNQGGILREAIRAAKSNGRLIAFPKALAFFLPNLFNSWFVTKIIGISCILVSFLLLSVIWNLFFKKNRSQIPLFVLLLSGFQIRWDHYLSTAYPFGILFFNIMILLAFFFQLSLRNQVSEQKKILYIFLSILFLNIGLMGLELYYSYLPLYYLLVFTQKDNHSNKTSCNRKFKITPRFLNYYFLNSLISLQLLLYILFKKFISTGAYKGTMLKITSFVDILNVIVTFSITTVPWSYLRSLPNLITNASLQDLLLTILGSSLLMYLSLRYRPQTYYFKRLFYKKLFFYISIGLYLTFIPNVLVSLTEKYQDWANRGVEVYVTSFFSTFGHVFLWYLVFMFLLNRYSKYSRYIVGANALLIGTVFFANMLSNFSVSREQEHTRIFEKVIGLTKHHPELNFMKEVECLDPNASINYKSMIRFDQSIIQKLLGNFLLDNNYQYEQKKCRNGTYDLMFNFDSSKRLGSLIVSKKGRYYIVSNSSQKYLNINLKKKSAIFKNQNPKQDYFYSSIDLYLFLKFGPYNR